MYIPSDDTANGIIAVISTVIGTAIGGVAGFLTDPDNRWIVQLGATIGSSFVLFFLGKGIDIVVKIKLGKKND